MRRRGLICDAMATTWPAPAIWAAPARPVPPCCPGEVPMPDLFIHIGSPKTGTTAIQHFLSNNRDALLEAGLLYPRGGMVKSAHHVIGAAIFPGRFSKLDIGPRDEALRAATALIQEEAAAHNPHTVVISTEYLWGELGPHHVRRLLRCFPGWQIHIVAYLRRQDLLAQSLYLQLVKSGYARSFADWLAQSKDSANAGFRLDRVLESWRVGREPAKIVTRVYERLQIDSDIRVDFLRTVCPQVDFRIGSEDRRLNTAPDRETVELLLLLNRTLDNNEAANRLRRHLIANVPPRGRFAPLAYFTPQEVEPFMAAFAAGNEHVARNFLGRQDGRLFLEPLPDAAARPANTVDEAAMLHQLVEALPKFLSVVTKGPVKRKPKVPQTLEQRRKRKQSRAIAATG